jgi:voltage-gated potassium channel
MKNNRPIGQRLKRWLLGLIRRFLSFVLRGISELPHKIKHLLFAVGAWGKQKLDRHFSLKQRAFLHRVIFESDTREGRRFDTIITWVIVASIIVVILETVAEIKASFWWLFFVLEWLFTLIFTVEYILRLYSAKRPVKYATSFFGIVDLLAILPTYLSIFFLGAQHLLIVRALRLLRVFRIFKMGHFVSEGYIIVSALQASKVKIYIFISFILLMSMLIGSMLYIVEGSTNPDLNNIPKGIYWAIVTLTTVGYGDVTPVTAFGKFLATVVMVMGYGVIAVPTGIVTAEISGRVMNLKEVEFKECADCGQVEHHTGSLYCHNCGQNLS